MSDPICFVILMGLAFTAQEARGDHTKEEAQFRKFLAEEIRHGLLPELRKFKQSGSRDWGRMAEKKIIIPAVEKTVLRKRIVITPKIEKTVKYKDGDWHRYTAEADDPDRNLKVEILDFKEPTKDRATFSVKIQAKLKVRGDVAFYRLDVGAEIPVEAKADLVLVADCRADLTRKGEETDIVLKVKPRELKAPEIVMTRLGPLRGDDVRKAGDLLRQLFGDDFNKQRDDLLNQAKDQIRKAVVQTQVKSVLLDVLLDR